jgi:opacity protein-like surface antigen
MAPFLLWHRAGDGKPARRRTPMRRAAAVLTLGVVMALPASARAGGLDIRFGGFQPSANSNLFDDDETLYTIRSRNWRGLTGGAEFSSRIARNVEIGFHLDGYERQRDTHYRDFFREEDGSEIRQKLKLDIVPVGVTVRIVPTSRNARIAPYIGAGADAFFWKYEEFGDFVDFGDPDLPVIADSFRSDGVATGFHVAGGLRLFVSDDFAVTGEVRYTVAKANMHDDFEGNRIDLGGFGATVGMHLRF